MSEEFEYRRYKSGDETSILSMLKKSFPKWHKRSLDYWKWKYLEAPYGVHVYLAADGDKVIGTFCEIQLRLKLGDHTGYCMYGDDAATDPDYRGRGVYSNLYKYFDETCTKQMQAFSYWSTQNPIVAKSSQLYGSNVFPFSLCRMIKIKDTNRYLKSTNRDNFKNKLGFNLMKGVNSLQKLTSDINENLKNLSIENVTKFDETIDVFWDQIKKDYNFILEKKQGYLNWKYCTYNTEKYQIRQITEGDEVLGYSVLGFWDDEENSEGSIMDLLALPTRPDVAESLIDDALAQFEFQGINSVYYQTIRGHPYQKLLAKKGFIDVSRASMSLIYYSNNDPDCKTEALSGYSPKSIYFNFY